MMKKGLQQGKMKIKRNILNDKDEDIPKNNESNVLLPRNFGIHNNKICSIQGGLSRHAGGTKLNVKMMKEL